MKICFTGDLFLGGDLLNKDATNIINVNSFKNSDRRIINLEQAISDSDYIENKCTLFTGSSSINQLKELKIDAVNIANNHIQDKGKGGINETREHLLNNEIGVFGAGKNLADSLVDNDYEEIKDANLSFHTNECKSCDYSENVGNEFIDSIARLNEFYINL